MAALGAVTLIAAWRSEEPLLERLQIRRDGLGAGSLFLATGVGIGAAHTSAAIASMILPDEAFALFLPIAEAFADATLPEAIAMGLAISVGPALAEELLFRGYVQRRFLARWSPAAAIAASTLLFSASHLHPVHALTTLPLGLWLGVVAWRAQSIWPGVLIHGANNAVGAGLMTLGPIDGATGQLLLALLTATGCLIGLAVTDPRFRPRQPAPAPEGYAAR